MIYCRGKVIFTIWLFILWQDICISMPVLDSIIFIAQVKTSEVKNVLLKFKKNIRAYLSHSFDNNNT